MRFLDLPGQTDGERQTHGDPRPKTLQILPNRGDLSIRGSLSRSSRIGPDPHRFAPPLRDSRATANCRSAQRQNLRKSLRALRSAPSSPAPRMAPQIPALRLAGQTPPDLAKPMRIWPNPRSAWPNSHGSLQSLIEGSDDDVDPSDSEKPPEDTIEKSKSVV